MDESSSRRAPVITKRQLVRQAACVFRSCTMSSGRKFSKVSLRTKLSDIGMDCGLLVLQFVAVKTTWKLKRTSKLLQKWAERSLSLPRGMLFSERANFRTMARLCPRITRFLDFDVDSPEFCGFSFCGEQVVHFVTSLVVQGDCGRTFLKVAVVCDSGSCGGASVEQLFVCLYVCLGRTTRRRVFDRVFLGLTFRLFWLALTEFSL